MFLKRPMLVALALVAAGILAGYYLLPRRIVVSDATMGPV